MAGYSLTVRRDAKVFTNGPYLFGFTSSFRMGQLLRYAFDPPHPPAGADLEGFMATAWIDALRDALKVGGFARSDGGEERGGNFLVGVNGRLFEIEGDYQVGEPVDGYAACGCGAEVALGALHATSRFEMAADDRAMTALRAAERHSAGVRGPFTLLAIGDA